MAEKLNDLGVPHWAATSMNQKHSYTSSKALGQIWDYAESKILAMVQPSDAGSSQANKHIIAVITKAREKDASRVDDLHKQMKVAVDNYCKGMSALQKSLNTTAHGEEERIKRTNDWKYKYCDEQRMELILCQSDEGGKNLAAAVLYQATLENAKIINGELKVRRKSMCAGNCFSLKRLT